MCEESDNDDEADSGSDTAGPPSVSTVSDDDSVTTTQPSSVESNRAKFSNSGSVEGMRESGGDDEENHSGCIKGGRGGPAFKTLSKSLGAKDFSTIVRIDPDEPPPFEEDTFEDAHDNVDDLTRLVQKEARAGMQTAQKEIPDLGGGATVNSALGSKISTGDKNKVYLSAAISIDYAPVPPTTKYIR